VVGNPDKKALPAHRFSPRANGDCGLAAASHQRCPLRVKKRLLVQGVLSLLEDDALMGLVPVIETIERASKGNIYRHELWNDMARAIKVHSTEPNHGSLC
jgi:hypothetical protein